MIDEATVDAYDESEQALAWFTVLDEHVSVPFATTVLGAKATVTRLELRDNGQVVALCERGREKQAIGLVDLALPSPKQAPCYALKSLDRLFSRAHIFGEAIGPGRRSLVRSEGCRQR